MKRRLKQILNHNNALGILIGWFYRYWGRFSPFPLLLYNDTVAAFYHPLPSYREHVLVLPREIIRQFCDLEEFGLLKQILLSVHCLCEKRFPHEKKVLLVNGGARQEIQQLHFHLIDREESNIRGTEKVEKIEFDETCLAYVKSIIEAKMRKYRGFTLCFDLYENNTITIYFS